MSERGSAMPWVVSYTKRSGLNGVVSEAVRGIGRPLPARSVAMSASRLAAIVVVVALSLAGCSALSDRNPTNPPTATVLTGPGLDALIHSSQFESLFPGDKGFVEDPSLGSWRGQPFMSASQGSPGGPASPAECQEFSNWLSAHSVKAMSKEYQRPAYDGIVVINLYDQPIPDAGYRESCLEAWGWEPEAWSIPGAAWTQRNDPSEPTRSQLYIYRNVVVEWFLSDRTLFGESLVQRLADAVAEAARAVGGPSATGADTSASASEQAEQEHRAAVLSFNSAGAACANASKALATAISSAQSAARTDPAMLQDPALVSQLSQAITTAQAVPVCTVPTMAADTATIQEQTTQLSADVQPVTSAAQALEAATQAVTASVQAKKDADAAAAQKANDEAYAAAHTVTVTLTSETGFSATTTVVMSDWIRATDTALAASTCAKMGFGEPWAFPGDGSGRISGVGGGVSFYPETSVVAFGQLTVTNTTPGGFTLPPVSPPVAGVTVDWQSPSHVLGYDNQAICTLLSIPGGLYCSATVWQNGRVNVEVPGGLTWGWPFFIVLSEAFSPKDPDGLAVSGATIRLGAETSLTLNTTW